LQSGGCTQDASIDFFEMIPNEISLVIKKHKNDARLEREDGKVMGNDTSNAPVTSAPLQTSHLPQESSILSASPFAKARFSEIDRSVKAGIIHFKNKNKNDTEKI